MIWPSLPIAVLVALSGTGSPPAPVLRADYSVTVADTSAHLFHVSARFTGISQPQLSLSLPTWTPGWYTIENYGKNVLRFRITDGRGSAVPVRMTRKQTWAVDTRGVSELRAEFDYRADKLALNQAVITADFAFFTGTQLFLEPVGHRDAPITVHLSAPPGWRILSALRSSTDSATFTAANYDELVDSPTEMGRFDLTTFTVEGKAHIFAMTPAGRFKPDEYHAYTNALAKIVSADSRIFDGLPYEKYVYFYFLLPSQTNAAGGLEHANSHVAVIGSRTGRPIESMLGLTSHEFFHTFNVKRIRPIHMWPYDYSRENETPLLWFSEGFTNYYGDLAILRAGLTTDSAFVAGAIRNIGNVESNPARRFVSLADASTRTWLGYDSPQAFTVDYYGGGQAIATLLDILLRSSSGGTRGVDDIMRSMWNERYRKNRGITTADIEAAATRASGRDLSDFFARYVEGTDVPPYDSIFALAGYRVVRPATDALSPWRLESVLNITPEQARVREAWLRIR